MLLTLKLLLTPLLIAVASLVQHRWGGSLGGLIAGLPLTSAPVSVFLALEQGPAFAARSATGTLLGVVAMSSFCTVYARSAQRLSWPLSTVLAAAACATITIAVSLVPQNLVIAALIAFPALPVLVFITGQPAGDQPVLPPPWWDTPARMVVASGAVILITGVAEIIGPTWSGLLTTLPVFACVMGAFSHHHGGYRAAHGVLRGIAVGALGSAAFFLIIGALVEHMELIVSYSVAVVFSLGAAGLSHKVFS